MTTATWHNYHQLITHSQRSTLYKGGRVRENKSPMKMHTRFSPNTEEKLRNAAPYGTLWHTNISHTTCKPKDLDCSNITVLFLPWLQVGIVPNVGGARTFLAGSISRIPVSWFFPALSVIQLQYQWYSWIFVSLTRFSSMRTQIILKELGGGPPPYCSQLKAVE